MLKNQHGAKTKLVLSLILIIVNLNNFVKQAIMLVIGKVQQLENAIQIHLLDHVKSLNIIPIRYVLTKIIN